MQRPKKLSKYITLPGNQPKKVVIQIFENIKDLSVFVTKY